MFNHLFHLPEEELGKLIERVLSNKHLDQFVERIARRVTEALLERLLAALRDQDDKGEKQ
jgi:hypothetical protein